MNLRCRGCGNEFATQRDGGVAAMPCPHCGAEVVASLDAVPRTASSPAAETQPATRELLRTCPLCATRFPAKLNACPECRADYITARDGIPEGEAWGPEDLVRRFGVVGGLAAIAIAVVWFVLGWQGGWVFFYPLVLAFVGIVGLIQGLRARQVAGPRRHTPPRPPSRRRPR